MNVNNCYSLVPYVDAVAIALKNDENLIPNGPAKITMVEGIREKVCGINPYLLLFDTQKQRQTEVHSQREEEFKSQVEFSNDYKIRMESYRKIQELREGLNALYETCNKILNEGDDKNEILKSLSEVEQQFKRVIHIRGPDQSKEIVYEGQILTLNLNIFIAKFLATAPIQNLEPFVKFEEEFSRGESIGVIVDFLKKYENRTGLSQEEYSHNFDLFVTLAKSLVDTLRGVVQISLIESEGG